MPSFTFPLLSTSWDFHSPPGLCEVHCCCSCRPEKKRSPGVPLSGQLAPAGSSASQGKAHITLVRDLFRELGLLLNVDKSTLVPTPVIEFVGANLDTASAWAFLPRSCILVIKLAIRDLQAFLITTARTPGPNGHVHMCHPTHQAPHATTTDVAGMHSQPFLPPVGPCPLRSFDPWIGGPRRERSAPGYHSLGPYQFSD